MTSLIFSKKIIIFNLFFLTLTNANNQNEYNENLIHQTESPLNDDLNNYHSKCFKQKYKQCNAIPVDCMRCAIDKSPQSADCVYGEILETECTVSGHIECQGERKFKVAGVCRFCYQTPDWMHVCTPMTDCKKSSWVRLYKVNCTVQDNVVCLGNRAFNKRIECNWTSGYKWNVAMLLSVSLGGFGIDRFYLGLIKGGFGKLFSFGGLGVWTLIDIILIYIGYVGPADGSIYI